METLMANNLSDRCHRGVVRAVARLLALVFLTVVGVSVPQTAAARAMTFADWLPLAEAGNAEAQCQVGVAYVNGTGVSQDFVRGLAWLDKSSDAGFPYARYVLADVHSRGYAGVPVNYEKAYYYASLAAASTALPEKYRERAIKLRESCAKRLSPVQVTRIQAMTALAPLNTFGGY
jgi:uncharacterized protein